MSIVINLDVMMAKRKKGLTELAGEVDITLANLSILKNNKAKAVRLSTLDAICKALHCQPGDILEYLAGTGKQRRAAAGSGHGQTGGCLGVGHSCGESGCPVPGTDARGAARISGRHARSTARPRTPGSLLFRRRPRSDAPAGQKAGYAGN